MAWTIKGKYRLTPAGASRNIDAVFVFVRILVLGLWVSAGGRLHSAGTDVWELHRQLGAAQEGADKPAIVELSRRLLEADSQDSKTWKTLAQTQLEVADFDRLAVTLNDWEKAVRPRPALIDDLRGDVAEARKDHKAAERYWRYYVGSRPQALDGLEKLADLCAAQSRWREAEEFRTRALLLDDNAVGRIRRANLYLELHEWDKAFADSGEANELDPTDDAVKEWLPQFELLKRFVPRIKVLDAQIERSPGTAVLRLERAHLFTLANRPNLALPECKQAMKPGPGTMRARIQMGEALLDLGRTEEAAKLDVSNNLARDENKHVNEGVLRAIGACDVQVLQYSNKADPVIARAKTLRRLNQYILALADARAALALEPNSASAHFEAAHALDALGHSKEAMSYLNKATEIDPYDPVMWYYRGLLEAQRADFTAAIQSQSRSLALRESAVALLEREKCERRTGRIAEADADATRSNQFPTPQR